MARLNTQQLIAEMRREQREDHQTLVEKVDEGFQKVTASIATHVLEDTTKFAGIETRLIVVEGTRKTMRWFMGAAIVAFLGALAEFVFNHATHVVKP